MSHRVLLSCDHCKREVAVSTEGTIPEDWGEVRFGTGDADHVCSHDCAQGIVDLRRKQVVYRDRATVKVTVIYNLTMPKAPQGETRSMLTLKKEQEPPKTDTSECFVPDV